MRVDVCTAEDGLSIWPNPWQFWSSLKTQKHSPSYKQLRWCWWSSHRETSMSYLGMLCAQRNNLSCQFSSLVVTKWVINMLCNSNLIILMCIDFILCGEKSSLLIIGCNISPWQRQKLTTGLSSGWDEFAGNGALSLNTLQQSTGIPEAPLLWGEMLQPLNQCSDMFTGLSPFCPCLFCRRSPERDMVLQMWLHQCWIKGKEQLTPPAVNTSFSLSCHGCRCWEAFLGVPPVA